MDKPVTPRGINHLVLNVRDIEESHRFWTEVVGFRQVGHLGTLDCDVFVQGNTCSVLEMNPRFGGGYPFSHAAGANVPAAMIAWANGQPADPACFAVMPHVIATADLVSARLGYRARAAG